MLNLDKYKVSIIIANYNNSKYLPSTINSLLHQSHKNIEIIIIDDCSTDGSQNIIREYAKKNKRIKCIFLKKNAGSYHCRNEGLKIATGDYITLLDSDDFYLSDRIRTCILQYINYEKIHPNKFEILFSKIYRLRYTEIKIESIINDKKIMDTIKNERKNFTEETLPWGYKYILGMATIFVKYDFFKKYGSWRSDYKHGMDIELIQRYLVLKYNKLIPYGELWNMIYYNKTYDYGIIMENKMNYISQPMNNKNSTIICKGINREEIHKKCENDLRKKIVDNHTNITKL